MKVKRRRIKCNTKVNAIEELSKIFKMSYGRTFQVYMEAMKYCRIFNDTSVIDRMKIIVNKPKISKKLVYPFTNVSYNNNRCIL
jgi:hypothetical protein